MKSEDALLLVLVGPLVDLVLVVMLVAHYQNIGPKAYCESIGETHKVGDNPSFCSDCYENVAGKKVCDLGSKIPRKVIDDG